MNKVRLNHNVFEEETKDLRIERQTLLQLKFDDHFYVTTNPEDGQKNTLTIVGAKLQMGAGVHGRIFYRITPSHIQGDLPAPIIYAFLEEEYDWIDTDYSDIASEAIEKLIEVARKWHTDIDYTVHDLLSQTKERSGNGRVDQ